MEKSFCVVYTDNLKKGLDIEKKILSEINAELIDAELSDESVEELIRDADGIIVSQMKFDREIIESLEKCRIISRTGIGFENIDLEAATKKGIYVSNVPDYCIPEVSDHVIGLALCLERNIIGFDRVLRREGWENSRKQGGKIRRIKGQTMGLVAFGKIPKEVCKKAISIGFNVIVYDPYVDSKEINESNAIAVESLDELLIESDLVSLHVPLTPETKGLIGKRELELIGENGFIINTSRGGVIDEKDLVWALKEGKILGAGLDVYENEPFNEDNPLIDFEQVILTPHIAFKSKESECSQREIIARNIKTVLEGNPPINLINKEVLSL